jgi:hypothetical protein
LEPWPGTAAQYKDRSIPGFTQKYHVTKLVWYEPHNSIRVAIARQKEIKSWRRMNLNSEIEGGFIEIPWSILVQVAVSGCDFGEVGTA